MPYVYFIFKIAKKNLKERSFAYGNSELHTARIKDSHAPPYTPITLPLTAFPPRGGHQSTLTCCHSKPTVVIDS